MALLNRDGLDRTGRQICCQHNLYRNENFLGFAAEKLKSNAPKMTPSAAPGHSFLVSVFPADQITLEGRF